jgi:hypothetical protein
MVRGHSISSPRNSMNKDSRYIKAPGRGSSAMTYRTLWFGQHELLQVEHVLGGENYEHLFYRDICAIYVRPTMTGTIRLRIFLVLLLLSIYLCFQGTSSQIIGVILGALSLIIVLNDFIRGPTCECFATTPVQRYKLYPWNRMRVAKKGAAMLRERVMKA